MTPRECILAAFDRGADEFAAVIPYQGIFVRDHWDEATGKPWWHMFSPVLDDQAGWRAEMLRRTGCGWLDAPACGPAAQRAGARIEVDGDAARVFDSATAAPRTVSRPRVAGEGTAVADSVKPAELATSEKDIDRLIPLPAPVDIEAFRASGRADLADALRQGPARDVFSICHVGSPLWRCYHLWGFEDLMVMVAERPELVRYAAARYGQWARQAIDTAAALGADALWIEECMTDMISPKAYEAVNLPLVRQITDTIRARGMRSVFYYCGDPSDRWDLLLDAGADALSLEEGKKGFEINIDEVVRRAAGRCTVLGNLDAVGILQDADDARLAAEVRRQLDAGRRNGGKFVMSLGSPVTPSTGVARVRRYCDLVHGA